MKKEKSQVAEDEDFNFVEYSSESRWNARWGDFLNNSLVSICASNGTVRLSIFVNSTYFSKVERVQIFVDAPKKVIGVKPTLDSTPGSYRLTKGKCDQQTRYFSMISLIKKEKIASGRYPVTWNKKYELLTFRYDTKT